MVKDGKIAVIGDRDSILAFRAVGAETFSVANSFEANDLLKKLSKGDYAVIFISEDIAKTVEETLAKLKTRAYPSVIPIPASSGASGFGMAGLKKDMEKAIGVDILFGGK